MPDIPRDPRQLARDILAGKVRIENLARERQMRQPPASGRVPDKIPLPRPAAPRPPMRNPTPPPRPQYPAARQPFPQTPRQKPLPSQQRPMPAPARPQYTVPPPQPQRVAPVIQPESEAPAVTSSTPPRRPIRLRELARSRHAMRQGIILAEILGKPVALRDEQ